MRQDQKSEHLLDKVYGHAQKINKNEDSTNAIKVKENDI